MVIRKCLVCKKNFDAKTNAKTCSNKCRKQHLRQYKKRDYEKNREKYSKQNKRRYRENKKSLEWYYNHRKKRLIYHREWRNKHPDYMQKRHRKYKIYFVGLLGNKCEKCGYDWRDEGHCIGALDFHHVSPEEKEREPARAWRHKKFHKGFEQKIKTGKIQLLCANCHREFHNQKIY